MEHVKRSIIPAALATLIVGTAAVARDIDEIAPGSVSVGTCLEAALAERPGVARSLEFKSEEGVPVYEFDVETGDGIVWNVECDAETGLISEIEREVAKTDPLFAGQAKITEQQARDTALAVHPGTVVSHEYVIEPNGSAAYEFDIATSYGGEVKVEVDATTGEITEANIELWEIGPE